MPSEDFKELHANLRHSAADPYRGKGITLRQFVKNVRAEITMPPTHIDYCVPADMIVQVRNRLSNRRGR